MNKENKRLLIDMKYKELLLQDLCARLPYGVRCNVKYIINNETTHGEDVESECTDIIKRINFDTYSVYTEWLGYESDIENIKLYLRPMSSMTEEEKKEFQSFFPGCFGDQWLDIEEGTIEIFECSSTMTLYLYDFERMIDWLNAHHFDYRGLIEKDLAISSKLRDMDIQKIKDELQNSRKERYDSVLGYWKERKPFKDENSIPDIPIVSKEDYDNIIVPNIIRCGGIPKENLVPGETYIGSCRNATEAIWDGERFTYQRTKFGSTYPEKINHFQDDDGYDVFVPIRIKEGLT